MKDIPINSKWICVLDTPVSSCGDIVTVWSVAEHGVRFINERNSRIVQGTSVDAFRKNYERLVVNESAEHQGDVAFDMMAGIREYLMDVFMSADDTVKFMDGDDCQPIEVIECLEALGYRCSTSGGNFSKGTLRYKYESSIYPDVYLRIYAFDGLVSMGVINSFKEEE